MNLFATLDPWRMLKFAGLRMRHFPIEELDYNDSPVMEALRERRHDRDDKVLIPGFVEESEWERTEKVISNDYVQGLAVARNGFMVSLLGRTMFGHDTESSP